MLPLFLAALVILPSMIAMKSRAKLAWPWSTSWAASPRSSRPDSPSASSREGALPGNAKPPETVRFTVEAIAPGADPAAQRATLDRRVLAGEIDAWLWIYRAELDPHQFVYHAENVSNPVIQGRLEHKVSDAGVRGTSDARRSRLGAHRHRSRSMSSSPRFA